MRKAFKALGITLLAGSLLVACNDDDDDDDTDTPVDNDDNGTSDEQVENDDNGVEEDIDNDDSDGNTESDDGDDSGGELGSGQQFDDQLDLAVGDTAQISSNSGEYEITIESLEYTEEVDGKKTQLNGFIIADVTVTNIGDSALDRETTVGNLEITESLSGSGISDYSSQFEGINHIEGEIAPGETVSGELLFEIREGEEQFIRIGPGLIASDAVKNDVRWTFQLSDIK